MRLVGLALITKNGGEERNTARWRSSILGVVLVAVAFTPLMAQRRPGFPSSSDWPMFGQNPANTASNAAETGISTSTAPRLKTKWTFLTGGDVSARAAVVKGVVYFPDWGGNLWALNASTGEVIWSHQISDYGLAMGTVSRTSPTVANGILYIGTRYVAPATAATPQPPTGWLLAIDAASGNLWWKMQPDTSNPFPVITGSPVVARGMVFVPMTSNEEYAAANPAYPCCSVSGSVVAVDALFGLKLWETFTVPKGYSGGGVWGSNPVVDLDRGTVFVGTGNNYSVPTDPRYVACVAKGGTRATCQSPDNHADSILALDMNTGRIKWATRLEKWNQTLTENVANGSDFSNADCISAEPGTVNCPIAFGPDYDFGSAPNEITYQSGWNSKTIIGAGQKSGIYYALDPDTGAELWHTQVGPGSSLGGIEWGSATDGTRIYVAICDFNGIPYAAGSAGSWAALDPATGAILWQKADPNGGFDIGPMAVANGVVYADSMGGRYSAVAQTMLALDSSTGETLWSFSAGSSVNAGATIVDGTVYWGSGYGHMGAALGSFNYRFYAFSIDGK
jgi:polyvinyl alcohol dehydrogenase (cytochrome)